MSDRTFQLLARLGYAARGVVYLLVGGFAIIAAIGQGRAAGSKDALETVLEQPLGSIWVAGLASGLLLFAFWRMMQAVLNADHLGSNWRDVFRRVGYGIAAVVYVSLAVTAVSLVWGIRSKDAERSARDWTAEVLALPLGQVLVGALGAILCAVGINLVVKGFWGRVDQRLGLDPAASRWIVPLGRAGFVARGIVFGMAGAFLVFAAIDANPREARGLAGTLRVLQGEPYGWAVLGAVAIGLFAFGVFQLTVAWYRRIDTDEPRAAARKLKTTLAA